MVQVVGGGCGNGRSNGGGDEGGSKCVSGGDGGDSRFGTTMCNAHNTPPPLRMRASFVQYPHRRKQPYHVCFLPFLTIEP